MVSPVELCPGPGVPRSSRSRLNPRRSSPPLIEAESKEFHEFVHSPEIAPPIALSRSVLCFHAPHRLRRCAECPAEPPVRDCHRFAAARLGDASSGVDHQSVANTNGPI